MPIQHDYRRSLFVMGVIAMIICAGAVVLGGKFFLNEFQVARESIRWDVAVIYLAIAAFFSMVSIGAIVSGIRGKYPGFIQRFLGFDEAGQVELTDDPVLGRRISPVWALAAVLTGVLILLGFMIYYGLIV